MKTPREILLGNHQAIEPRLDALREQFVAGMTTPPTASAGLPGVHAVAAERFGWRELILMVRWHLAGLAAMWLLIALLGVAGGADEAPRMAQHKVTSPRTVILVLKENRRQILEFGSTPTASAPPSLKAVPQSRRSHLQMDRAYS